MKALKLKLFLIQELISISFLKKGLEDDQINRSFYTVRKLLNSYHKNIEKNKLKLTPENLLQKSGYADNFNELPPLTEHVFNTQKEKFSQLEKLSELEMEKWAISVVKYQMEITKNNLKNQNLSISNIQELTKRALNI